MPLSTATTIFALIGSHAVAAYGFSGLSGLSVRPTAPVASRPAVFMQYDGMQGVIADDTYQLMIDTLLNPNVSVVSQIGANYAMIDYGFLQKLDEKIGAGGESVARLTEVKDACNAEMAKRMTAAAEALRDVLTSPTPVIMEGKIAGLARQGRIDDAVLQLLQANLEQAQAAGEQGKGAVAALSKLQQRVQTELDNKLSPQAALLRQLMRMDDKDARLALLRQKMAAKKASTVLLASSDGSVQDQESSEPEVSPRLVAEAITEIKARFGNVDENYDSGFVDQLLTIADEAEAVALDLSGGKELTSRQQQELMWEKGSVSVWDLGQVEEEAHQDGNMAVWEQEAQEQMARQDSAMRKASIDTDWVDGSKNM